MCYHHVRTDSPYPERIAHGDRLVAVRDRDSYLRGPVPGHEGGGKQVHEGGRAGLLVLLSWVRGSDLVHHDGVRIEHTSLLYSPITRPSRRANVSSARGGRLSFTTHT